LPALHPSKIAHFLNTNNTQNTQRENYRQKKGYKQHLVEMWDSKLIRIGESGGK